MSDNNQRLRTTIFIEANCDEDFEWALEHAVKLARAHVIQMTFSKQGDPLTRYGVRTAKVRRKKVA